jgi:hypothetical protein
MSFPKSDRSFHARGRRLIAIAAPVNSHAVARQFADAIRAYTDKQLARMAGACPRTFRNHRQGLNAPSAVVLINLMRESDEVFNAVLEMAGRDPNPHNTRARIEQALQILTESERRHDAADRVP